MKTFVTVAGFAGVAMAQAGYGAATTSAPASTTYACNPAHQYPGGQVCTEISGSLTLVSPTTSAQPSYACNPAHQYPGGEVCTEISGSLTLVTPTPTPYAGNATHAAITSPVSDATVTAIVTSFTTVCPSPTTLTYNSKTYTVTSATTLTITDCPCTITTPAKSLPPATTVTAIVSSFTTVCPSPTTLTINSKTYTVTQPTTLTISDCADNKCRVTAPASALWSPPPQSSAPVAPVATYPAAPVAAGTGSGFSPNGTTPNFPTRTAVQSYTGAAQKVAVAGGAGLVGLFAAALL